MTNGDYVKMLGEARKLWIEKRREIVQNIVQKAVSLPGQEASADRFIRAQSVIDTIDKAIIDEERIGRDESPTAPLPPRAPPHPVV